MHSKCLIKYVIGANSLGCAIMPRVTCGALRFKVFDKRDRPNSLGCVIMSRISFDEVTVIMKLILWVVIYGLRNACLCKQVR